MEGDKKVDEKTESGEGKPHMGIPEAFFVVSTLSKNFIILRSSECT